MYIDIYTYSFTLLDMEFSTYNITHYQLVHDNTTLRCLDIGYGVFSRLVLDIGR